MRTLFFTVGCLLYCSITLFSVQSLAWTPAQVLSKAHELRQYWDIQAHQLILIDPVSQTLYLEEDNVIVWSKSISTSRFGLGSVEGSYQTPTGMHRIVEKYGEGAKIGTVFRSRLNSGWQVDLTKKTSEKQDLVLTRILRLRGLEPGLNSGEGVDSYKRCIYLHGTAHEHKIGQPSSRGCIRLLNLDIIHLFERVMIGDYVYIRTKDYVEVE